MPEHYLPSVAPPKTPWLHRLRRGSPIWLTKEGRSAEVCWPWIPPEPGHMIGTIAIRVHGINEWYSDDFGMGLDGSQILQPCLGHLPEHGAGPIMDRDRRALYKLHDEVDLLKRRVAWLSENITTIPKRSKPQNI